jgi:hypothetical protein
LKEQWLGGMRIWNTYAEIGIRRIVMCKKKAKWQRIEI